MKQYVKPELYYESFQLAQHIAGCNIQIVNSTLEQTCRGSGTISFSQFGQVNTCYLQSEKWFTANLACADSYEDYCYTNSKGSAVTINS